MDKCYTQKTTKKGQTELGGLGVGPLERFGGNPKSFFFWLVYVCRTGRKAQRKKQKTRDFGKRGRGHFLLLPLIGEGG